MTGLKGKVRGASLLCERRGGDIISQSRSEGGNRRRKKLTDKKAFNKVS